MKRRGCDWLGVLSLPARRRSRAARLLFWGGSMNYSELISAYFERSTALQWYWTIYVIVIGGAMGFSTLRRRPEFVTTLFVTILYAAFAYKNLGAIEATAEEREAIRAALRDYPES